MGVNDPPPGSEIEQLETHGQSRHHDQEQRLNHVNRSIDDRIVRGVCDGITERISTAEQVEGGIPEFEGEYPYDPEGVLCESHCDDKLGVVAIGELTQWKGQEV